MKPNRLAGIRRTHGYSQQYVADALGIPLSTFRAKETGRTKFDDKQKAKLKQIYDLSWNDFNEVLYDGLLPNE